MTSALTGRLQHSFFKYAFLMAAAVWCLVLAIRLFKTERRALGAVSILVLVGAIWGQRGMGPGTIPSWKPEYIATVVALGWFLALSVVLAIQGFRISLRERRGTS